MRWVGSFGSGFDHRPVRQDLSMLLSLNGRSSIRGALTFPLRVTLVLQGQMGPLRCFGPLGFILVRWWFDSPLTQSEHDESVILLVL
jgi:hypothetical protein